jgi:hypothetical protein
VNEAASKHRWSLCLGGSDLPLFPTNPHHGTLLSHLIPHGNKFFRHCENIFSVKASAPAIAVG